MMVSAIATISASISASLFSKAAALTSWDARKVISTMPAPRGSTMTGRSRRLKVTRPIPTSPASAIAAPITRKCLNRDRAIRINIIRVTEIHRVDLGARHEGFEVDDLRAFHVECLELGGREGDELAALVFVALGDLLPLDLLAAVRVVRAKGDAGRSGRLRPRIVKILA